MTLSAVGMAMSALERQLLMELLATQPRKVAMASSGAYIERPGVVRWADRAKIRDKKQGLVFYPVGLCEVKTKQGERGELSELEDIIGIKFWF